MWSVLTVMRVLNVAPARMEQLEMEFIAASAPQSL